MQPDHSTTSVKRKREREDPLSQPHPSTSSASIPLRRQSFRLTPRSQDSSEDILRGLGSQNSPPEDQLRKRRKFSNSPERKVNSGRNGTQQGGGPGAEDSGRAGTSRENTGRAGDPNRNGGGVSRGKSCNTSDSGGQTSPTGTEADRKPGTSTSSTDASSVGLWDTSRGELRKASAGEEARGSQVKGHTSHTLFSPLSQGFGSQRGRRRLMCLDEDATPTEDLIHPSAPDPETRRIGPYADILHPTPKKIRPKHHNWKRPTEMTSPTQRTDSRKTTVSGQSRSSEWEGQVTGSTLEDDVFAEPRLELLPRPRRSTEEFKMGCAGRPVPKRGARDRRVGRGQRRRLSGPPAFLCLTSLHSR